MRLSKLLLIIIGLRCLRIVWSAAALTQYTTTLGEKNSSVEEDETRWLRGRGRSKIPSSDETDQSGVERRRTSSYLRKPKATHQYTHSTTTTFDNPNEHDEPPKMRSTNLQLQQQEACTLSSSGTYGVLQNQKTYFVSFNYQVVLVSGTTDFEINDDLLPRFERAITEGILPGLFECPGTTPKGPLTGLSMDFPDIRTTTVPCLSSVVGRCQAFEGKIVIFGNGIDGKAEAQSIIRSLVRRFIVEEQGLTASALQEPRILDSLFVVQNNGVFERATAMPTVSPTTSSPNVLPTQAPTPRPTTRQPTKSPTTSPVKDRTMQPTPKQPTTESPTNALPTSPPTASPTPLRPLTKSPTVVTKTTPAPVSVIRPPSETPTIAPLSMPTVLPSTIQQKDSLAPAVVPVEDSSSPVPVNTNNASSARSSDDDGGELMAWRALFIVSFCLLVFILLFLLFCILYRFHDNYSPYNKELDKKKKVVTGEAPTDDISPEGEIQVPAAEQAPIRPKASRSRAKPKVPVKSIRHVSDSSSMTGSFEGVGIISSRSVESSPSRKKAKRKVAASDDSSARRPIMPDKGEDSPSEASTLNSYSPLDNDDDDDDGFEREGFADEPEDKFERVTDQEMPYNENGDYDEDDGSASVSGRMARAYDFREATVDDPYYDPDASYDSLPATLLKSLDADNEITDIRQLEISDSHQSISKSFLKGAMASYQSLSQSFLKRPEREPHVAQKYESINEGEPASTHTLPRSLLKGPESGNQVNHINEMNRMESDNTLPRSLLRGPSQDNQVSHISEMNRMESDNTLPRALLRGPSQDNQVNHISEMDRMESDNTLPRSLLRGPSRDNQISNIADLDQSEGNADSLLASSNNIESSYDGDDMSSLHSTRSESMFYENEGHGSNSRLRESASKIASTRVPGAAAPNGLSTRDHSTPTGLLNHNEEQNDSDFFMDSSSSSGFISVQATPNLSGSETSSQSQNSTPSGSSSRLSWNSNLIVVKKAEQFQQPIWSPYNKGAEDGDDDDEEDESGDGEDNSQSNDSSGTSEDSDLYSDSEEDPLLALESIAGTTATGRSGQDSKENDEILEVETVDDTVATNGSTSLKSQVEALRASLLGTRQNDVKDYPHSSQSEEGGDSNDASGSGSSHGSSCVSSSYHGSFVETNEVSEKNRSPNVSERDYYAAPGTKDSDSDSLSYEEVTVYTEAQSLRGDAIARSLFDIPGKSENRANSPIRINNNDDDEEEIQEVENEVEIKLEEDDDEEEEDAVSEKIVRSSVDKKQQQKEVSRKEYLPPGLGTPNIEDFLNNIKLEGSTSYRGHKENKIDSISRASEATEKMGSSREERSEKGATSNKSETASYYKEELSSLQSEITLLRKQVGEVKKLEKDATNLRIERDKYYLQLSELEQKMVKKMESADRTKKDPEDMATIMHLLEENESLMIEMIELKRKMRDFEKRQFRTNMNHSDNSGFTSGTSEQGNGSAEFCLSPKTLGNSSANEKNGQVQSTAEAVIAPSYKTEEKLDKRTQQEEVVHGQSAENPSPMNENLDADKIETRSIQSPSADEHNIESNSTGSLERQTDPASSEPVKPEELSNNSDHDRGQETFSTNELSTEYSTNDHSAIYSANDLSAVYSTNDLSAVYSTNDLSAVYSTNELSTVYSAIDSDAIHHLSPEQLGDYFVQDESEYYEQETENTAKSQSSHSNDQDNVQINSTEEKLGYNEEDEGESYSDDKQEPELTSLEGVVEQGRNKTVDVGTGSTGLSVNSYHSATSQYSSEAKQDESKADADPISPAAHSHGSESFEEETLPDDFNIGDACISQEDLMNSIRAKLVYDTIEEEGSEEDDSQSSFEDDDSMVDYALHTIVEEDEEDDSNSADDIGKQFSFFSDHSENDDSDSGFNSSLTLSLNDELRRCSRHSYFDPSSSEASIEEWNAIEEYPRLLDGDGDDNSRCDSLMRDDSNLFSAVVPSSTYAAAVSAGRVDKEIAPNNDAVQHSEVSGSTMTTTHSETEEEQDSNVSPIASKNSETKESEHDVQSSPVASKNSETKESEHDVQSSPVASKNSETKESEHDVQSSPVASKNNETKESEHDVQSSPVASKNTETKESEHDVQSSPVASKNSETKESEHDVQSSPGASKNTETKESEHDVQSSPVASKNYGTEHQEDDSNDSPVASSNEEQDINNSPVALKNSETEQQEDDSNDFPVASNDPPTEHEKQDVYSSPDSPTSSGAAEEHGLVGSIPQQTKELIATRDELLLADTSPSPLPENEVGAAPSQPPPVSHTETFSPPSHSKGSSSPTDNEELAPSSLDKSPAAAAPPSPPPTSPENENLDEDDAEHLCDTCGLDCTALGESLPCVECREAFYCSPECAQWDWDKGGHSNECSRKYSKKKKSRRKSMTGDLRSLSFSEKDESPQSRRSSMTGDFRSFSEQDESSGTFVKSFEESDDRISGLNQSDEKKPATDNHMGNINSEVVATEMVQEPSLATEMNTDIGPTDKTKSDTQPSKENVEGDRSADDHLISRSNRSDNAHNQLEDTLLEEDKNEAMLWNGRRSSETDLDDGCDPSEANTELVILEDNSTPADDAHDYFEADEENSTEGMAFQVETENDSIHDEADGNGNANFYTEAEDDSNDENNDSINDLLKEFATDGSSNSHSQENLVNDLSSHVGASWNSDESGHNPKIFAEMSSDEEDHHEGYPETYSDASSESEVQPKRSYGRQKLRSVYNDDDDDGDDEDVSEASVSEYSSEESSTSGSPMPTGEETEEAHEDDSSWE